MFHRSFAGIVFAVSLLSASVASAQRNYLVADTEALTPQEQIKKFKLPPGFEIQLVASEPTINKPMNINFDSRGRMWVTSSIEYPWPVTDPAKARDRLTVFTGIGADGRPASSHVFADKLNIPIGVLPLKGGSEAIVWSVPHIWKMTDTDGDDIADKREILFGPFDFVDTHGNQNGFKYHIDGWVYANHGYRNNSINVKAKGEGPTVISMNSGNTYRFRPDGSAIEIWSNGQVNPFGLTFDNYGNIFAADCHSKACTMMIRGAYYESFGKPHDGLGYGPNMTNHDHGSSGIGGIAYYAGEHFPKEYRECLYIGNVVTGIVHRDVIKWNGSTPWVDKPEDFITCDDPWFHPVDIQMGPDGALYICDFYNCIIGHYEVDLKHPRRDRERGRIWRVVYKGTDGKAAPPREMEDLHKLAIPDLLERTKDANITTRHLAANRYFDISTADNNGQSLRELVQSPDPLQRICAMWLQARLLATDAEASNAVSHPNPLVRVHGARIMAELPALKETPQRMLLMRTADGDAMMRRATADALGRRPDPSFIKPLLESLAVTASDDTTGRHTIRIALRNQLRAVSADQLAAIKLSKPQLAELAQIALAVPTEAAAWFAFEHVLHNDVPAENLSRVMQHVARHVGDGRISDVIKFVRGKFEGDIDQQLALFQSIHAGMKQRGTVIAPGSDMKKWGYALASDLLDPSKTPPAMWTSFALDPTKPPGKSPFGLRERTCDDGQKALFIDSIVGGEQLTGIFRSQQFEIPKQLSFYICGHNGLPGTSTPQTNVIRLKLVEGGAIVAEQSTPRSDTAKKYVWDLSKWAGKKGVIEIVDTDTRDAYAWLAVSRFEPAVVRVPAGIGNTSDRQAIAIAIAGEMQLTTLAEPIFGVLTSGAALETRLAAATAVQQLNRELAIKPLVAVARNGAEAPALRVRAAQLLASSDNTEAREAVAIALATSTAGAQQQIALALASSAEGADALLNLIAAGKASPRLLQDRAVKARIDQSNPKDGAARIAALTKNLPAAEARINKLIADRSAAFAAVQTSASAERGLAVFKTNCAACHKIGDVGNVVGPQLSGIGVRGHERLLEDILDSNRNVDAAFKSFIFTMKEGDVITGMKLREEGKVLVIADAQGKEVKLNTADIADTRPSTLSPMPGNFAEVIAEKDLFDLLAFLLAQKQAEK